MSLRETVRPGSSGKRHPSCQIGIRSRSRPYSVERRVVRSFVPDVPLEDFDKSRIDRCRAFHASVCDIGDCAAVVKNTPGTSSS